MRTAAMIAVLVMTASLAAAQNPPLASEGYRMHALDRPQPRIVIPGRPNAPVAPPADAIVLFDGTSLTGWRKAETSEPAGWRLADGYMEVVRDAGTMETRQSFGDVQLHVEWAAPTPPANAGQNRGNSGVFLMGRYEVQVLDSHNNTTYPDGQAGAIYGQYPPLVNASRPPGEWQTYDIVFHAPRFSAGAAVESPARMTVFHNGVLVQDNVALLGPTSNQRRDPYVAHADRLPLRLQDHGDPVRFRNIWVRELK